jgi:hypothetical protein
LPKEEIIKKYVDYNEVSFLAKFLHGRKEQDFIHNPQYKALCKVGFLEKGIDPKTQESESILSERGREELDILLHNLSLKDQLKFLFNLLTRRFAR